ncbi:hypothetical protein CEXT_588051 [Caerostris extrusa]|uniref:CCHC-type domain-containing protein n=1 Tax=Caerostris extrusa TaxID=172846 RepID=A0AAV4XJT6_CAEEX|nr:hypothetical protein CEXT_588051 [Caerostris extrusa]
MELGTLPRIVKMHQMRCLATTVVALVTLLGIVRSMRKLVIFCGKRGHISRDCEQDDRKCYGCGKIGHISRDCPEADKDERKCYNCGAGGHISKECPESGNYAEADETICYKATLLEIAIRPVGTSATPVERLGT